VQAFVTLGDMAKSHAPSAVSDSLQHLAAAVRLGTTIPAETRA
jgi:hypothetical protein